MEKSLLASQYLALGWNFGRPWRGKKSGGENWGNDNEGMMFPWHTFANHTHWTFFLFCSKNFHVCLCQEKRSTLWLFGLGSEEDKWEESRSSMFESQNSSCPRGTEWGTVGTVVCNLKTAVPPKLPWMCVPQTSSFTSMATSYLWEHTYSLEYKNITGEPAANQK